MSVSPGSSDGPAGIDPEDPSLRELLERCTFPEPGSEVTCAVSGGADSTALVALAVAAGLRVEAVHVDHSLRPGSDRESAAVRRVLSAWGVPLRAVTVPVAPGGDLEARARSARQGALPPDALLGHTADDQAETVLLRILRGTGPTGLAAMRAERHPMLRVRRSQTHALCTHLGVTPFHDPSNDDPRFRRNRVRHELLPLLDDIAARDVVPLLCRLAELSADQADLLDALAATVDPTDAAELAATPVPVAATAIRTWWRRTTHAEHPPDAAAVTRIMDVAGGRTIGCDVLDGWTVRRTAGRLRLERDPASGAGAGNGDLAGSGGAAGERG